MHESMTHPDTERLHGFVEDSLDDAARSTVDAHLLACSRCSEEVAELRSLFMAFESLPELAPSAGFADRVMTHVRVRRPAFAWATDLWAWLDRITPTTTRGWALAAALLALPVVGGSLLIGWLLSQPGVTPQSLWVVGSGLTSEALGSSWQAVLNQVTTSTIAVYAAQLFELLGSIGRGEIGLAVVMFATATAASIYVLYQNLFRTGTRRMNNASYVF